MPAAHVSAGPYGTYPSLPPPPPRTLSTVPLHPSVPEDALRWEPLHNVPQRPPILPGRMQATHTLNSSGWVTQCTLNITFYEVHPGSGAVVRALTDTLVLDIVANVYFNAQGQPPCAAGVGGAAVDEASGWLYYPVVAALSGPMRYDMYGEVDALYGLQTTALLVRQLSLAETGGSGTLLQQDFTNTSNPLSDVRWPPSVALSGPPADSSAAGAAFLLLIPGYRYSNLGYWQPPPYRYWSSVLAVDLSGSGVVRARPVGLGVEAAAWAIDQSTGSGGTSTYDMYLLYTQRDGDACRDLAHTPAFLQTPLRPTNLPCSSWWLVRDKGAASAAAIATWPVVSLASGWSWSAADSSSMAADPPPGVDVEVIPFTLTTFYLPVPAAQLAARGSKLFLSDPFRCQILEINPVTGAAKVIAGHDGGAGASGRGSCTGPVCSFYPINGPAIGSRPIGSTGRMAADESGALLFYDETAGRLRRLLGRPA